MDGQLEKRLAELRAEYESGQKILKDIELKLAELENRKRILSETILRISGAIDLLEEMLGESEGVREQEVKAGTTTSTGNVEVPNVVRQPLEKAKEALEEAGLSAGEIVEQKGVFPIGVTIGEVIKQEPNVGTKLPAGSAVKLIIASKGKFLPHLEKKSECDSFPDCR